MAICGRKNLCNTTPQRDTEERGKRIQNDLGKQLDWSDYDNIIEKNEQNAEVTFLSTKRRLVENFNKLKEKRLTKQSGW